ncbi:hypothetical protein BX286_1070 [Streptomyces sp. 3211.6]|uniref:DUF6234 family protein n=1 Tax=Streptomyces TaxID=1883 RepID=UPI000D1ADD81|nr:MULTISPECIES: DUF6234 family protein [Streptomyces]RKT03147.1 hypothetical protein BX286_1070 [Streptomyces sp. 3211.6]RPF29434.1 hypothetical protein EDD96_5955 [Streptomyces sp. Ag109_G2-6]
MTRAPLDAPRPRRHWPWSHRTSTGADVTVAVLLLLLEAAVFVLVLFGHGMEGWAAQGDPERIEAADLAGRVWMSQFLVAMLVLAVLAMVSRARWTVASHLLAAAVAAALLVLAQHDHDRSHPRPAPRPGPEYVPCYSGSGRCN